jgi:hypothetical protein
MHLAWLLLPSFLAALPVLLAIFGGPEVKQTHGDVWGIGLWFVLLVAAEALPVPMIRGGTMTVASILDIGAILLFGPWVAGTLDLVTTILAQIFILRRPSAEAVLMVAEAGVTELRRGRCWGCYMRWAESRPVGRGAAYGQEGSPRLIRGRLESAAP